MTQEQEEKQAHTPSFPLQLFYKRQRNEISQEEFDQQLAYWTLQTGFENMKYTPMPIPPQDLKEYYAMDEFDKKKVSSDFWKQEDIKLYIQLKDEARISNDGERSGLEMLLKNLPEKDEENRAKVQEALTEFDRRHKQDEELMKGYKHENSFHRPKYYDHGRGDSGG